MTGISWQGGPGKMGDICIHSSFPENYFRATGEKLVDLSNLWSLEFNPFVVRNHPVDKVLYLWSGSKELTGKTIAENICQKFEIPCILNSPRLYRYERVAKIPRSICINTTGVSVGSVPQKIINHIREKYYNYNIFQVGLPSDRDFGGYNYRNHSLWDQIKILAECETAILIDSFWLHVACAYNIRKKVLFINRTEQQTRDFLPLTSPFSFGWIPNGCEVFNTFSVDLGVTRSYKEI